jgi:hypothetical protein
MPIAPITLTQSLDMLLAIAAMIPAAVSTGYLTGWLTDLEGFRRRSFIERLLWSLPLSVAVSPIVLVLCGKLFSLSVAAWLLWACAIAWVALLAIEVRKKSLALNKQPYLLPVALLAICWIMLALFSLVDFQSGDKLYFSVTLFDHAYRINWTEAILRTGVPPANPLYFFQHPALLRYYYFHNTVCATVAQMWHLNVQAVFRASCVWAGFSLVALIGLFLKHFLQTGDRLRRQFLITCALLMVTGLDIIPNILFFVLFRVPLPADMEWWSNGQIASWVDSLLWVPHHIDGLIAVMFAFLICWMAEGKAARLRAAIIAGFALASAFGMSIYVTFAFAIVAVLWTVWQLAVERSPKPVVTLASASIVSGALLVPYLVELIHANSAGGTKVFSFAVREMLPPELLLHLPVLAQIANPQLARTLSNLLLLAPGYALELGFYLCVLVAFLVPAWHRRAPHDAARRTLVVLALASLLPITFIRSWILNSNDFGWRSALLLQFVLLLLAGEWITSLAIWDSPKWFQRAAKSRSG